MGGVMSVMREGLKFISELPGIPGYCPRRNNLYSQKAT
jgi:hypothetical protein